MTDECGGGDGGGHARCGSHGGHDAGSHASNGDTFDTTFVALIGGGEDASGPVGSDREGRPAQRCGYFSRPLLTFGLGLVVGLFIGSVAFTKDEKDARNTAQQVINDYGARLKFGLDVAKEPGLYCVTAIGVVGPVKPPENGCEAGTFFSMTRK